MKPVRSGWRIWPVVIIIRYWVVQGAMYMNWVERLHRWSMEGVLLFFLFCMLEHLPLTQRMVVSALISHTLSMILNGHVFAMLTHDLFWYGTYREKEKFIYYVDEMYARLQRKQPNYIKGAVFFGSLTRGIFRTTSDLDIRFVAKDGVWNAVKTAHLVFIERLHAFFARYPIDTYMFMDEREVKYKMDVINEHPVSLYSSIELADILSDVKEYPKFRDDFLLLKTDDEA